MIIATVFVVFFIGLLAALSEAQRHVRDPRDVAEQELRSLGPTR